MTHIRGGRLSQKLLKHFIISYGFFRTDSQLFLQSLNSFFPCSLSADLLPNAFFKLCYYVLYCQQSSNFSVVSRDKLYKLIICSSPVCLFKCSEHVHCIFFQIYCSFSLLTCFLLRPPLLPMIILSFFCSSIIRLSPVSTALTGTLVKPSLFTDLYSFD